MSMINSKYPKHMATIEGEIRAFQNILEKIGTDAREKPKIKADDFSKAYTAIYEISTDKTDFHVLNCELYKYYRNEIKDYLVKKVFPSLRSKRSGQLLEELEKRWIQHELMVKWMSRLFQYLERFFIVREKVKKLEPLGIDLFRNVVIEQISSTIIKAYLSELSNHRDEKPSTNTYMVMARSVEIFATIAKIDNSSYIEDFQRNIIENSKEYYSNKYLEWADSLPPEDYLENVETLLLKEQQLIESILPSNKYKKPIMDAIFASFDANLIKSYQETLQREEQGQSEFIRMVEERNEKSLKKFYSLFSRLKDNFEGFHQQFKSFIFKNAKRIFDLRPDSKGETGKNRRKHFEFIESLIKFYEDYEKVIEKCFEKKNYFNRAFRGAMESLFDIPITPLISDQIAEFIDLLLNKNGLRNRNFTNEEKESLLLGVLKLFACLSDKDKFLMLYEAALVQRVINDLMSNLEHERMVVEQIKAICGTTYTQKLEDKLKDIHIANTNKEDFETYVKKHLPLMNSEMIHIKVLEKANWLNQHTEDEITLPEEIKPLQSCYMEYLKGSEWFKKKDLFWIHSVSTVVITTRFSGRKVDITLGMYQFMIVNLFQRTDELTFEEIVKRTRLNEEIVASNLAVMVFCKGNKAIFTSSAKDGKFSPDDAIKLNMEFNPKRNSIQIDVPPTLSMLPHDDDKISLKREFTVRSVIAKVMKARKRMSLSEITEEIQKMIVLFRPSLELIKKAIKYLVDQQIIEEVEDRQEVYKYV